MTRIVCSEVYSSSILRRISEPRLVSLSNEYLSVMFDLSSGQIASFTYRSQLISIRDEQSLLLVNETALDCPQPSHYVIDSHSITFTYLCSQDLQDQLMMTYVLKPAWNVNNATITSTRTSFTITNIQIPSVSWIRNQQNPDKQHTIFLLTNFTLIGMFATWQYPFGYYSSFYEIGISASY